MSLGTKRLAADEDEYHSVQERSSQTYQNSEHSIQPPRKRQRLEKGPNEDIEKGKEELRSETEIQDNEVDEDEEEDWELPYRVQTYLYKGIVTARITRLADKQAYSWNDLKQYGDMKVASQVYRIGDIVEVNIEGGVMDYPAMIVDIRMPREVPRKNTYPYFLVAWFYDRAHANEAHISMREYNKWPEDKDHLISSHFQILYAENFRGAPLDKDERAAKKLDKKLGFHPGPTMQDSRIFTVSKRKPDALREALFAREKRMAKLRKARAAGAKGKTIANYHSPGTSRAFDRT